MIKKATLLCLGLSLVYIISIASSSGRASAANEGNTGAPGDNPKVCSSCHNGGSFSPKVTIALKDEMGNEVNEYLPNNTYQVEVSIDATNGSPTGYGFQMVSLRDADNSGLSAWSNPSSNAKIASAMGRSYVEHAGVSTSNVFIVDWLAPEQGTGSISFYAAGNAVNKNGSTSGDAATTSNVQIQEAISSSVSNTISNASLQLFPNPVQDILNLHKTNNLDAQIELFNNNGMRLQILDWNSDAIQLDLSNQRTGQYILQIRDNITGSSEVHKIIKL